MNNSEILDEIDRLSVGQKFSTSSYYFDKLFQKSKEEVGEEGKKHLELLSRLCSISLSPDDEEKPYKPVFINHGAGTRSADIEDFTDEELAWLVQFAQEGRHPELIGKIFDISFIRTKNAKHALLALKSYSEALQTLIGTNDAYEAVPILKRTVSLIKRFNQFQNAGSPIQGIVISFMEGALASPEYPAYAGLGMSRPFLDLKEANHLQFAELCERVAIKFKKEGHFFKENEFYDLAASFYKRGRDNDRCNACLVKAAEVFEIAAGHQSNPMQAGNLLERAIEGYRSVGNSKEKVDELHRRLLESQSHTVNYMGRIESPKINISKQIEYAREHVKKETLLEAVYALSRIMSIPSYSEIKESALKTIKEHPILFLFKKTGVDRRGRVIASIDPAIQGASIGENENPGLWAEIVEQAEHHHQINAQAFILPAIQQIIDDHFLDEEELIPLLKSNPFVEPRP